MGCRRTAIEHIHISHQGGLGRTLIDAAEHDLPALGYVASAGALAAALRKAVDAAGIPVFDETEITNLAAGEDDVIASLAGAGRPRPRCARAWRPAPRVACARATPTWSSTTTASTR